MADKPIAPSFKLSADVKTRLTTVKEDMEKAKAAIATLKKLGMDTSPIEEKLVWAEDVRNTLLKEFG